MKTSGSNSYDWIHIWKFDSTNVITDIDSALLSLSEEERARSQKFIYEPDKIRYINAHYFLRQVLNKYLKTGVSEIKFSTQLNGKPCLKNVLPSPLYFNLAYRNTFFLAGISNKETIGVDVEKIRTIEDVPEFCKNYFSEKELKKIMMLKTKQEQLELLFTFWAMKEAVIKALAVGFSQPLPNYDLSVFLEMSVSSPSFDSAKHWMIQQIHINKNYKAAFAINSDNVCVEIFDYCIKN